MTRTLKTAVRGVALAAALAFGSTAGVETLTIASPGVALHFHPFCLAEKAGRIADEGITLDRVDVGSGSGQIAAVAGGSVEVPAVGMQAAIGARQNGADLVPIAAPFKACPIQLVRSNATLEKTGIAARWASTAMWAGSRACGSR